MEDGTRAPSRSRTEYRRSRSRTTLAEHPDRLALWAFATAIIVMVAAAASAHAGSGGTSTTPDCSSTQFGKRVLRLGDCGNDVRTLNWILRAKSYSVPLRRAFHDPTKSSVESFQRKHDLSSTGVVRSRTRRAIVRSMHRDVATWYGPGFFGSRTACGEILRRRTIGVANRRLPCGTKVTVGYHGHYVRATVIDRGPYANNADWDLTQKTARELHFSVTDKVRVAPIH